MVTARQQPRLVLVSLTCEGGRVCLNGPDMEELRFPVKQADNRVTGCRCHAMFERPLSPTESIVCFTCLLCF